MVGFFNDRKTKAESGDLRIALAAAAAAAAADGADVAR